VGRILRRATPVALLLVVVLQGSAMAATVNVSINNFAFTPDPVTVAMGSKVNWTNNQAGVPHTATSDATNPDGSVGIKLWDSRTLTTGGSFAFAFRGAGSFPYMCTIHPFMTGTVQVPPVASPVNGQVNQTFTITFAQANPGPFGFVFDVQKKDPAGSFQDYATDVQTKSVTFTPTVAGTYQFRVRAQRVSTGGLSLYSPAVSITAS
jgi:plastocyanin